jgi:hypothetical protein
MNRELSTTSRSNLANGALRIIERTVSFSYFQRPVLREFIKNIIPYNSYTRTNYILKKKELNSVDQCYLLLT